jgi:hypothetical protein
LKPWQRKADRSGTHSGSSAREIAKGSPSNKGATTAARSIPANIRAQPPDQAAIYFKANNIDATTSQRTFNPDTSLKSINTNTITADEPLTKPKFHRDPSGLIQTLDKKE